MPPESSRCAQVLTLTSAAEVPIWSVESKTRLQTSASVPATCAGLSGSIHTVSSTADCASHFRSGITWRQPVVRRRGRALVSMVTRNDAYSVVRSNTIGPRVCVACSPAFGACAAPAWWSSDCHKYFRFRAERRCFWALEVRVLGCTYLRGVRRSAPEGLGGAFRELGSDP